MGDLSYFTVTVSQLASGDIRFSAVSVRDAGLVFKRTVPLSELSILSGETCESDAGVQSAVAVLFDRVVIVNSRLEFLVSAGVPWHCLPAISCVCESYFATHLSVLLVLCLGTACFHMLVLSCCLSAMQTV